ncbi:hypothetical protein LTR08_001888 [Meristemomyces frigidus]|nr:hypothetical protein LTR08_001888 [Meristemomyces frigidus]
MERFVLLIGGEEKLPPKMPQPPPAAASPEAEAEHGSDDRDDISKLPSVDAVITEESLWQRAQKHNASLPRGVLQPQFTPTSAAAPHEPVDLSIDTRMGDPAPLGISFTPFGAVTKLCYKSDIVRQPFRQPLATAFFDANKIYTRDWDLYYVWSDYYQTAKPTIFVPEHQVRALIDEINLAFPEAKVKITDELREDGLVINFNSLPKELRPKWLGHCISRDQHDYWIANTPPPSPVKAPMAADRDQEAFKTYMQNANDIAKAKSKAKKNRTNQAATVRKQDAVKQVLRAQRYLGLAPKKDVEGLMPDMAALSISAVDPSRPAPHPFDSDAIIIAIDCEAYENSPRVVTEIGFATLDTRDLRNNAPGAVGADWHKHIRGRHFRIIEHKHLINYIYCRGCPDKFDYGRTEFIRKDDIASKLTECFHEPFSGKGPASNASSGEEKRNIILLGHDISQDINYCSTIGFQPLNRGNILDVLDSADMYRFYARDVNPSSLGNVCYAFDLTAWHPHNAGNDAVHTVWAFLAVAIKEASERGSKDAAKKLDENVERKTEAAVDQAREKVQEEADGWDVEDGEDGGVAVPPKAEDFGFKKSKGQPRVFGPEEPAAPPSGFYTMGGARLDV